MARHGVNTSRWTGLLVAGAAALSMLLAGCTTGPEVTESWPEHLGPHAVVHENDTVSIKFPYTPELDEEQTIRPDGKIAMPFIGDVQAAGKTPNELREHLIGLYDSILKNAELTVIVRSYGSRRVYIGGEVRKPGPIPIQGQLTLTEAIVQAGGHLKTSAKMSNVIVVRRRDDKHHVRAINLKKKMKLAESDPFYLEPNDIVIIPRSTIDRIDQWADQYLNKILPENVIFTFDTSLDDNSTDSGPTNNVTLQTSAN